MRFTFRDSETGLFKAVVDPRLTPTHLDSVHPEPSPIAAPNAPRESEHEPVVRLQFLDGVPNLKPLTPAS